MKLDYSNKTVLITGGTRGIGSAMADAFEAAGANLILTGTKQKDTEVLNTKYSGSRREYFYLDFTNMTSIEDFLIRAKKVARIDVLINNAGINILDEFVYTKDVDFNKLVEVNLEGPYKISKVIAEKMTNNKYGRILNICSIWSKITRPKRALYTMTKNALHGLTQTMAVELSKYNIMVNSLSPGFTLTELTMRTNSQDEIKKIESQIPIGRMASPQEIANIALFLSSDLNTYLTGQNIVVDGGYVIV